MLPPSDQRTPWGTEVVAASVPHLVGEEDTMRRLWLHLTDRYAIRGRHASGETSQTPRFYGGFHTGSRVSDYWASDLILRLRRERLGIA